MPGPAVELALDEQVRKEGPVVGSHKAQELGLPGKGRKSMSNNSMMTSLSMKRGLAPTWPCRPPGAWAWNQSSTQTYTTIAKSSNAILRAMGNLWNMVVMYFILSRFPF